ncbi:[FeFe] hydrogenase H-cluster radical SAM maturase HydE [Anaerovorax sp. IOR16]|uniref:[FeFe] hydrogenase H-cluster radical SAM maturase HydE n=1 Tax=Anaerovorax sp. IOR16 TaxID=2773458 RepID=UPI0019D17F62|nr:[FeFe] hydrogenase H-cluster radical SAM maturase HydE [Anaerovorax sp. IOR16]
MINLIQGKQLIDTLLKEKTLDDSCLFSLIETASPISQKSLLEEKEDSIENEKSNLSKELSSYLFEKAREVTLSQFQNHIYMRGLIEFTNYCKNDCYYCGIRKSNCNTSRYRLKKESILECCKQGHALGFRTFVLQGGEDPYYTDAILIDLISTIKSKYPDCALTLSLGEKSKESFRSYFEAGADRYLLRHETANKEHYSKLHPSEQKLESRKQCLLDLMDIGFQTGTGFMVGSPYQTTQTLVEDLQFIYKLQPHMVGIGPFLPHHDTPFANQSAGSLQRTLCLISILRLMLPQVLLPATTALGTIHPQGRELGILAGANVVMPNLSPVNIRKKYMLYDNKICTGEEAAECQGCLTNRMNSIDRILVVDRGDAPERKQNAL